MLCFTKYLPIIITFPGHSNRKSMKNTRFVAALWLREMGKKRTPVVNVIKLSSYPQKIPVVKV